MAFSLRDKIKHPAVRNHHHRGSEVAPTQQVVHHSGKLPQLPLWKQQRQRPWEHHLRFPLRCRRLSLQRRAAAGRRRPRPPRRRAGAARPAGVEHSCQRPTELSGAAPTCSLVARNAHSVGLPPNCLDKGRRVQGRSAGQIRSQLYTSRMLMLLHSLIKANPTEW